MRTKLGIYSRKSVTKLFQRITLFTYYKVLRAFWGLSGIKFKVICKKRAVGINSPLYIQKTNPTLP